jgi:hypothetical protein
MKEVLKEQDIELGILRENLLIFNSTANKKLET